MIEGSEDFTEMSPIYKPDGRRVPPYSIFKFMARKGIERKERHQAHSKSLVPVFLSVILGTEALVLERTGVGM